MLRDTRSKINVQVTSKNLRAFLSETTFATSMDGFGDPLSGDPGLPPRSISLILGDWSINQLRMGAAIERSCHPDRDERGFDPPGEGRILRGLEGVEALHEGLLKSLEVL